jgi:hypothetical protein
VDFRIRSRARLSAPLGLRNVVLPRPRLAAADANPSRTRYGVPAGALDDDPGANVIEHIHVGSKASWEVIGDEAQQYEGNGPPRRPAVGQARAKVEGGGA